MQNELILVVDDGKDNREFLIEYVLTPNGFRYLEASDGYEGLQLALEHRPDLILLDLQMPRMNGIQVLEQLQANGLDIPVILMTFHGSEDIAVEVYRLGVRDYIKKPYYAEEMLAAIERGLTETRLRREKEALTERLLHANRELQRRLKELNTLYQVGKSVTSLSDMQVLLPRIVDYAVQMTRAEEAKLMLLEQKQLFCKAIKNQLLTQAKAVNEVVQDALALHVLKERQLVLLTGDEVSAAADGRTALSLGYVPLLIQDRVLGVLCVANHTPNAAVFTQNDMNMLSALSDYAAIAIENSRNYSILRRSKDRLREIFERFVAPSVVEQVINAPESVRLGGNRQEISVLFADIRGYTTWSESVSPEQVIETLNHYLSVAAEVILSWEGTLDKFLGDGLMAIFNAPLRQDDHVYRVADAALAMLRAIEEVNAQYGHQLSYSIGLTVGEAVVGYIGTERAVNYTAIGDTVNLAKRLQENAAPNQILIDEQIVQRLGKRVRARPLGELRVKGRKTPAKVFELLGLDDAN